MAIHYMESAALRTDLDRGQKLVLMCYANSANDENRVGFPGFDALTTWSSLGRSQLYAVIAQLCERGLLVKVRDGGRGRRAEYAVFPAGDCCPMHGPLPGYSPQSADHEPAGSGEADPGPGEDPEPEPEAPGSGPPDPAPQLQGPVMGPVMGPVATGPLPGSPATPTHSEEIRNVSRGAGVQPPQESATSAPAAPVADGDPADPEPPRTCGTGHSPAQSCRVCGERRVAHEAWQGRALVRRRVRDAAERARQLELDRLRAAEEGACALCGPDGTAVVQLAAEVSVAPVTVRCVHDAVENRARAEARLRCRTEVLARAARRQVVAP